MLPNHAKFKLHIAPEQLESDETLVRVFATILIGYCLQTLEYYQYMATALRETFPQAQDKDIGCHQVVNSNCVKGFTLLTWSGKVNRKELGLISSRKWAELKEEHKAADSPSQYPWLDDEHKCGPWSVTPYQIDYGY